MAFRTCLHILLASVIANAQDTGEQTKPPDDGRTQWFREAKFGMFIHWGPYAVIGRHEWARHFLQIPQAEYDEYARRFNPVNYDPEAWVQLAKDAGMKYIVITSKHHDGFSIYRSEVSNYDMEITPYDGDPLAMLADACKQNDMRLGFYHSIMDWHHPDYVPRRPWETDRPTEGADLDRYIDFMKEQLRELLTNYGDVAVIWFDGEWEHTTEEIRSDEIYDFILSIQPETLINDRLYKRQPGNRADFGTPEQYVPATGVTDASGEPVLWESCVTINQESWGYNKYETVFKTERDLIRMLIEVVSKGGNLLLNVGPKPDGTIQDEFVSRLRAMGRWMDTNSDAIYGTTASCFRWLPFFGRCTVKGNRIYLHVFQWPERGALRLPGLKNEIWSAVLLADRSQQLTHVRDEDDVVIMLPDEPPDEIASVVEVNLGGLPVVDPHPIRPEDDGSVRLSAASCEVETGFEQRAKLENALGHVFITNWKKPADVPTWKFEVASEGKYRVDVAYGSAGGKDPADFIVTVGDQEIRSKAKGTGGAWVFKTAELGEVTLPAGEHKLQVKVAPGSNGETLNLEAVRLVKVE